MADGIGIKIQNLDKIEAKDLNGDFNLVVDNGTTYKATIDQVRNFLNFQAGNQAYRLNLLEEKINETKTDLANASRNLSEGLANTNSLIAEAKNDIDSLASQVYQNSSSISQNTESITNLNSSIGGIQTSLTAIQTLIDNPDLLNNLMNLIQEDIPGKIESLQADYDALRSNSWKNCTKSSNWFDNASRRIMNILSPKMLDGAFESNYNMAKARGVDHFNLILTNEGDGEVAGYSIYGEDTFANISSDVQDERIDNASIEVFKTRIDRIVNDGYSIVLWMTTNDSNDWNILLQDETNFRHLCEDIKSFGWFKKASAVVLGLQCNEYWGTNIIQQNCDILREYSGLKVGVHLSPIVAQSISAEMFGCGDLTYLQVNPGSTDEQISGIIEDALSTINHPVCMFEMEGNPDRAKSKIAFDANAWSVGNW